MSHAVRSSLSPDSSICKIRNPNCGRGIRIKRVCLGRICPNPRKMGPKRGKMGRPPAQNSVFNIRVRRSILYSVFRVETGSGRVTNDTTFLYGTGRVTNDTVFIGAFTAEQGTGGLTAEPRRNRGEEGFVSGHGFSRALEFLHPRSPEGERH